MSKAAGVALTGTLRASHCVRLTGSAVPVSKASRCAANTGGVDAHVATPTYSGAARSGGFSSAPPLDA